VTVRSHDIVPASRERRECASASLGRSRAHEAARCPVQRAEEAKASTLPACWQPDGDRFTRSVAFAEAVCLQRRTSSPRSNLGFRELPRVGTARPCSSIKPSDILVMTEKPASPRHSGGGKPPGNWWKANGLLACLRMRKQPGSMRRCRRHREQASSGPGPDAALRGCATLSGVCVETSTCGSPCAPSRSPRCRPQQVS
jgi:hypothetical protein